MDGWAWRGLRRRNRHSVPIWMRWRGYEKNVYDLNAEAIETVNRHWGFALGEWGYARVNPPGALYEDKNDIEYGGEVMLEQVFISIGSISYQ